MGKACSALYALLLNLNHACGHTTGLRPTIMAKLADNIKTLLAAAGVKLTTEQETVLGELPQDEVSATVQTLFDTAANQATSEISKLAAKAGNLDKFDAALLGWEDVLGEDIKTIASEKGLQKLDKVKAQIAKKIAEAKEAAGKGDNQDVEKLRTEITKLQQQAAKLQEDSAAEIEKVREEYEGKIHNGALLRKLQGRADILDSFKNEEALTRLVLPSLLEYAESKGLTIRPGQLDVVNKETQTPHLKGSKPVSVDDLFGEALDSKGWRQNADPQPSKAKVPGQGDDSGKPSKINLLRPSPVTTDD